MTRTATSSETKPINLVIYDGGCGVCQRIKEMASVKDHRGRLIFQAFQVVDFDTLAPGVTREIAAQRLILINENHEVRLGARAFFSAMAQLSGFAGWIGGVLANPFFSLLLEPFYRLFASNRSRISRWLGLQHCAVTYPEPPG